MIQINACGGAGIQDRSRRRRQSTPGETPQLAQGQSVKGHGGRDDRQPSGLSPQEARVLALVAEGKTNREIAVDLRLSFKTVKNYLSNAFQKLQVRRRWHAALVFRRQPDRR